EVTVGHNVILHGCQIAHRVLIGMGAIVLDNAEIGELSLIGAGALVTQKMIIPPRSVVLGSPAKIVREVRESELKMIYDGVESYVQKCREYREAASEAR